MTEQVDPVAVLPAEAANTPNRVPVPTRPLSWLQRAVLRRSARPVSPDPFDQAVADIDRYLMRIRGTGLTSEDRHILARLDQLAAAHRRATP